MSYLTTELLTSLLQGGAAANEFLRSKIEEGVNAVLKAELAGFLGYEKHSSAGWHTGNSRNGSYQRTIVTSMAKSQWMCRATATARFNRHYCRRENNVLIRWRLQSFNCTNAVSRRVKSQNLSSKCMAIAIHQLPYPRLQLMCRIRLNSFINDQLPSDMPLSFVMQCMSISVATA